jgi:hypothetical protein
MTRRLLSLMLLSASLTLAADKPADITQAGIQTAFRVLQREYIRSGDLTFDELNRAALQGLLERLQFGAELISRKADALPADPGGVQVETLRPGTVLLRPRSFTKAEVAPIEQHLTAFIKAGVQHLILDLRAPMAPGDFDVAAAVLELFVPQSEILFKTRQMTDSTSEVLRSGREPLWKGPLLILIDEETGNIGETIAAVLRQRHQALLIGAPTRGAAVRYETIPVDATWSLRFARAEVLLPDDSSIFQTGIQPDFPIAIDVKLKRLFFDPEGKITPKSTITDHPRPRFNEAALVAGTNPELDLYLRRSAGKSIPEDMPKSHDLALQRAADLLLTRDHLNAAKIDWKRKPAKPTEPPVPKAQPVSE